MRLNETAWGPYGNKFPMNPFDYPYGPYLKKFPSNPFVRGPAASKVSGGEGPVPGDGKTGWYFNTSTNEISPNDPDHKER